MALQLFTALQSKDENKMDLRTVEQEMAMAKLATECPSVLLPEAMSRQDRKKQPTWRGRYALWAWNKQVEEGKAIIPACTWCGEPTGNWCDSCEHRGVRPMNPLCNACEAEESSCRVCARGLCNCNRFYYYVNDVTDLMLLT